MIFFSVLGALIPLGFFIAFNIWSVEYPLGMRTFTVLTDTTAAGRTGVDYHFKIAKAFLWGDEEMVGLMKAFPFFLLAFFFLIPKFFKKFPLTIKILLLSSILYIFIGALTTPTRGGVQNFGLRYMETGILPLMIAVIFGINELIIGMSNPRKGILFLFLLLLLIPGFKFVHKGIKTLTTNSTYYYQMQNFFSEVGESYVIHDSLNSPYMVGTSFVTQKHIYVGTDKEMKIFEQKFSKQNVDTFMIISQVGTPYISINIPDFLYPKMFSKLQFKPEYYTLYKEENLFNFNMKFYKKK
jgi:hypothetical protein